MKKSIWMMALLLMTTAVLAKDKKPAPPSCALSFLVVRDYNGKPVRNAAVVMHPVENNGKQEKGGLELKTNAEGKTSFDGIPYGKLRVQVLAQGYQTFGEDFDIEQPEMELTIKLKRPDEQYSIYADHPKAEDSPKPDAKPQP